MNLLPRDHHEFVKPEYWDTFFKKRGGKAFEWYGDYPELCGMLHKYIKPKDKVLNIGCGNSQMSADMYDVGYHDIVNIDISDTVIRQMTEKNQTRRPDMRFMKMDVLNMKFESGEFTVVLDKGTLDALLVDSSAAVIADVEQMFAEVDRVLRQGGRYICISLLQEHIITELLSYFPEKGWPIRIHRINTEDSGNLDKDFHMPVFAVVFTKFKKLPGMKQLLEVCSFEEKMERLQSVDSMKKIVQEIQYYAVIREQVSKRKVTEEQVSLCLYNEVSSSPRYTMYIVDSASRLPNKFAIFIVPQGRETEWMFATDAGRRQVSASAGFERLVIVTLDRNHTFDNLDTIKAELSSKVMELAPPKFKTGKQVPFLSLGNDIGNRVVVYRDHSDLSGDFVVEDVEENKGEMLRRLIFLSTQNIVQSEARLLSVQNQRRKGGKPSGTMWEVDKSYLSCQHHVAMVAGLALLDVKNFKELLDSSMSVLLIGLGGGGLPTYIHSNFPQVNMEVVDNDPAMVTIAKDWFGFVPDEKLIVCVEDGLRHIKTLHSEGTKKHVVMLDVDSKDTSVGLSCPPKPFVEKKFLEQVRDMLHNGGCFILNLVCRDEELKTSVLGSIKEVFSTVYCSGVEDEVNDIVYAINMKEKVSHKDFIQSATEKLKDLQTCISRQKKKMGNELENIFKDLKLLDT